MVGKGGKMLEIDDADIARLEQKVLLLDRASACLYLRCQRSIWWWYWRQSTGERDKNGERKGTVS
jgi:hypothetical protein